MHVEISVFRTGENEIWKEMTLMEYGVVVAVIFVIAIGIYVGLKYKKNR